MDEFLLRALVGGLGVACVAGPFGCFVVWRRLAYFGDTLAHSALLGVALGFLLGTNLTLTVVAVCLGLALLLFLLQRHQSLASDTLLGILAHSALAVGLVVIGLQPTVRIDLMGYLFGDILAVSRGDLLWIWGGGLTALAALLALWRPLLALTVSPELARVEGVPVAAVELAFALLLALVVAVMMKLVGLVLVTALLIIPAATARGFVRSPEGMALTSAGTGCLAVALGLQLSLTTDAPAGPAIVVAAAGLFLFSLLLASLVQKVRPAGGS